MNACRTVAAVAPQGNPPRSAAPETPRARGLISTIAKLRERCTVDPLTHCWHWQGAKSNGQPRIWAFDHATGDKRAMSGPKAAWNIAFGRAPRGLAYRACLCDSCLNPAHLREARSKAEIGEHIRRAGTRKGTAYPARMANLARARAALGITPTPAAVVLAIRAAPQDVSNVELSKEFGLLHQTISRIRRGESHRHLLALEAAA